MADEVAPLFTWRSAVSESDLTSTQRHVAIALSLWMNERGASAYPGARRLATDTALAIGTIRRILGELVELGWLDIVERGGLKGEKRRSNHYRAVVPDPELPLDEATGQDTQPHRPLTEDDGSSSVTGHRGVRDPSSSDAPPLTEDDPSSSWSTPWSSHSHAREGEAGQPDAALADAVVAACYRDGPPADGTDAHHRLTAALAELARHSARPDQVPARARRWRATRDARLTPTLLARWWPDLGPEPSDRPDAKTSTTPTTLQIVPGGHHPSGRPLGDVAQIVAPEEVAADG